MDGLGIVGFIRRAKTLGAREAGTFLVTKWQLAQPPLPGQTGHCSWNILGKPSHRLWGQTPLLDILVVLNHRSIGFQLPVSSNLKKRFLGGVHVPVLGKPAELFEQVQDQDKDKGGKRLF